MTLISIPHIVSLSLDVSNLLTQNNSFLHELGGEALSHALHSFARRSHRRKSLSRRQMRKASNRKRRWFVDNIVMHHKRLHDRNRAIVVSNARSRALAKREALKKNPALQKGTSFAQRARDNSPQSQNSLRDRAKSLRGRVDARRMRTRSRWLSTLEEAKAS